VTTLRSTPTTVTQIRLVAFDPSTYQHLATAVNSLPTTPEVNTRTRR
jgi:hypothetical protein